MAKKKETKEKKPYNIYKIYEKKGDNVERKNPTCPKCGAGFFMAVHKNRKSCGKCKYTEFSNK